MNQSKLSKAPWRYSEMSDSGDFMPVVYSESADPGNNLVAVLACSGQLTGNYKCNTADGEFIALARNAYDIMMRRGWSVVSTWSRDDQFDKPSVFTVTGWKVIDENRNLLASHYISDPFTAIIEADKWYRENVENKQ